MLDTEINLTEQERNALQDISRRTGKTEGELVREALDQFIAQFQNEDQRKLMQQARGIWKDRQDLPSLQEIRNEWERI
jgi:hypothetical protein